MFEELRPHLIELRKRLFISIVSVFVCFGICFTFWNPLLAWMSEPLKQVLPAGSNIIFTQIQEPFFTAMKVAFFAGVVIALPIIFWQFWLFVAPGLYGISIIVAKRANKSDDEDEKEEQDSDVASDE